MRRLKRIILFSVIAIAINTVLNIFFAFLFINIPHLHNEYSIIEYIGAGIFHGAVLFVLLHIGGVEKSYYFIPVLYLAISIALLFINYFSGFELLFHLNFAFSRMSYATYESLKQLSVLTNTAVDLVVFNGVFFAYQMGLLFLTKKIFNRY